jgi:hypothetical protein
MQQINNTDSHLIHKMVVNVLHVIKIIKILNIYIFNILVTFYTLTTILWIKCESVLLICSITDGRNRL